MSKEFEQVLKLIQNTQELCEMIPSSDLLHFVEICMDVSDIWKDLEPTDEGAPSYQLMAYDVAYNRNVLKTMRLLTIMANEYGKILVAIKDKFGDRYAKLCEACNHED